MKIKFSRLHNRGASIIEFSIVAPLFLIVLLGLIDIGRYFASAVILNAGVQRAIEIASKIDITMSCPTSNTTAACVTYRNKRQKIIDKAVEKALGAWFSLPTVNSSVQLIAFSDTDGYNCVAPPCTYSALLLRPGERMLNTVTSSYTDPQHPSAPYVAPGPPANQNWATTLAQFPVYVAARARYRPILPFLPTLIIRADAIGYSSEINQSLPWSLAPLPSPTPLPSPNPSPSPGGGPPPSPSPGPSSSPAPTPFNCSTCIQCCYCSGGVCTPLTNCTISCGGSG